MQDPIKVCSLIFDAQDAFDATEAEKMAEAMGWSYGERKMDASSIFGCLASCVNAAVSTHHKNCAEGNPFKFIYSTTGRIGVSVRFFNQESPQVEITFGMQVWKS